MLRLEDSYIRVLCFHSTPNQIIISKRPLITIGDSQQFRSMIHEINLNNKLFGCYRLNRDSKHKINDLKRSPKDITLDS